METALITSCMHHWVIGPGQRYPTAWGICIKCYKIKEFANSMMETEFNHGPALTPPVPEFTLRERMYDL